MSVPNPAPPSRLARLGLPDALSRVAVLLVVASLIAAVSSIETARTILMAGKAWVVGRFDWLFVGVANWAMAGVLLVAVHPSGKLRLGPPDSRPEFGRLAWFTMLFSAGLASGLLYWATAEPILHLQDNPWLDEASAPGTSVTTALRITIFHWGLHGWAFYVLAGLAISVYAHRHGRALTFRTALYPILGPIWIDRWPGKTIDLLALVGTICGVATSIGLAAGSMNATLSSLFAIDVGTSNQVAIVCVVCGLGILSALSGLGRGIRRISEINVWVSGLLLASFFLLGPTLYLGDLLVETITDYVTHVIPAGLWIGQASSERAWQADWTVFYWGWWLAWTPFVSLFIARVSKGRTIRELAVAVLVVPTGVTLLWMVVLGGTAIAQEVADPGSVSAIVNRDYSLGLVAVLDGLTSRPASEVLVGIAAVLLVAGGLHALQAASIMIGLPLAGLILLVGGGLVWELLRGRM